MRGNRPPRKEGSQAAAEAQADDLLDLWRVHFLRRIRDHASG